VALLVAQLGRRGRSGSEEIRREFQSLGAYFMNQAEMDALAKGLVNAQRLPNPALVGKPAAFIAKQVGITLPEARAALIAPACRRWPRLPCHREAVPVLSFYVVKDLARGVRTLHRDPAVCGMGHTMSIHSKNEDVILQFG